jgi:hypothetical protein
MRNPTSKDFAEYFRLALEAGLCREHEVESWADSMIVETSSPLPDWLLSLSIDRETSKRKLLESVPGEADKITVWNLLLARFGIGSRTKQLSREQIVRVLFRWAVDREMPRPYYSGAYRLDDSFYGMKDGWYSENQFMKDFEDYFVPFRSYEALLPQISLQVLK